MIKFFRSLFPPQSGCRDIFLQALVAAVLVALGVTIFHQIQLRYNEIGIDFSFGFLGRTAGYEITDPIIEYEAGDSHGRALLTGVLSSLWLAVLVIFVSTLFAIVTTLACLSRHWVVSVTARCYCNVIRNTPLLLQLSLSVGIGLSILRILPWSLRGMEPSFGMYFTSRGFYFPWITNLLPLALVFLTILAVTALLRRKFGRNRLERLSDFFSLLVWVLPPLAAVTAFAWTFDMAPVWQVPVLDGYRINGGIKLASETIIAVWAFSIYGGVQLSDIFYRHTLDLEAKRLVRPGSTRGARPVIASLPNLLQKLKRSTALPSLNSYHTMFKNTALASTALYLGFQNTALYSSNQTGRFLEIMLIMFAFYIVVGIAMKNFILWVKSHPDYRDSPTAMYLLPKTSEVPKNSRPNSVLDWFRANLWYDWLGKTATVLAVGLSMYLVGMLWDWSLLWGEAMERRFECGSVTESCWSHISGRLGLPGKFNHLLIGFLPPVGPWYAYVSITLFFGILIVGAFAKLSQRKLLGLILLTTTAMWSLTPGIFPGSPLSELQYLGGLWLTLLLASLAIVLGFLAGNFLAIVSFSSIPFPRFLCWLAITGTNLLPPVVVIQSLVWVVLLYLFPHEIIPREFKFYASTFGLIAVSAVQFAAVIRESLMLGPSFPSKTERLSTALNNCIPALTATAVCQLHYTLFYQSVVVGYDFFRFANAIGTGADWLGLYTYVILFVALVYFLISNLILFAGRRVEARRKAQDAT